MAAGLEELKIPDREHPNKTLNDYVTYHVLQYLEHAGIRDELMTSGYTILDPEPSRVRLGALSHLTGLGILKQEGQAFILASPLPQLQDVKAGRAAVEAVAMWQIHAIQTGQSVRHAVNTQMPRGLIPYAPQCLMLDSYREVFENLHRIESDGVPITRIQPDNAMGSGEMMKPASLAIAKGIADVVWRNNVNDVAVLELGSGNAQTMVSVIKEFQRRGMTWSNVLATDRDPATRGAARSLYTENGLAQFFQWLQVDMRTSSDMENAMTFLGNHPTIIHIGYILHESHALATSALKNLRTHFPGAMIAVSEYFWQDEITPKVPLWFQTTHVVSGQDLKRFPEFISMMGEYWYSEGGRIVHNSIKGHPDPMNATLFFTL